MNTKRPLSESEKQIVDGFIHHLATNNYDQLNPIKTISRLAVIEKRQKVIKYLGEIHYVMFIDFIKAYEICKSEMRLPDKVCLIELIQAHENYLGLVGSFSFPNKRTSAYAFKLEKWK